MVAIKRKVFMLAGILVLLATTALPATAADVTVDDSSFRFSPQTLTRATGATVTWHKSGGFHNVSSTQGMFRSGDATSSAFTFSRAFSAGTYPYVCEVHPTQMRGTIRIRPRTDPAPRGRAFTVIWATPRTQTGTAFGVQFRVDDGRWRSWLGSTTSRRAVFGRDGSPVRVRPDRVYRFRVVSKRGNAESSASPVRTVRT